MGPGAQAPGPTCFLKPLHRSLAAQTAEGRPNWGVMSCHRSRASRAGLNPDLIKIDVEGHELDVLDSGRETVSRVWVVQFEFGGYNIDTRTCFHDLSAFARKLNSGPIDWRLERWCLS